MIPCLGNNFCVFLNARRVGIELAVHGPLYGLYTGHMGHTHIYTNNKEVRGNC
jgi:hypothetical protein